MNLLFLDLETTGLNERTGRILEVGAIVTNEKLEAVAHFNQVVHWQQGQIQSCFMDVKVISIHTHSGLLEKVECSTRTLFGVESDLVAFIWEYFPDEKHKPALYGNSVHFDKRWIDFHMPRVTKLLHYQLRDVSGMLGIMKEAGGIEVEKIKAEHRATSDCLMTIELLKKALEYVK